MLNATGLLLLISFVLESRLTRVRILIKVELARANSRKRAICPAEKTGPLLHWWTQANGFFPGAASDLSLPAAELSKALRAAWMERIGGEGGGHMGLPPRPAVRFGG